MSTKDKDIVIIEEEEDVSKETETDENESSSGSVKEELTLPDINYKTVEIREERDDAVSSVRNGKASFCFITVGQGSSGYYTEDVLKSAVPLFEGRPMFVDHHKQKSSDPGILYWAGDIQSAHYDPNGVDGPGIYGTSSVFPRWKDVVEEMIDSKGGVSIKARGRSDENGLIRNISAVQSVDYVVRAGRGGRVVELFESAIMPDSDEEVTQKSKKELQDMSAVVEEKKEETVTVTEESTEKVTEAKITENTEQGSTRSTENAGSVDLKAIQIMFQEALDAKMAPIEARLKLIESEGQDRDIVKKAIKEALAEETWSEDMLQYVEDMVWKQRRDGIDLEEQSKLMVESLKPIFNTIQQDADKKVEEATKKITNVANQKSPTILEHVNNVYSGKDGQEELSEAELEKQLAASLANVIGTSDVSKIEETIVKSRGE